MNTVTLNKDEVQAVVLQAESETKAVVAIFQMVYPNFDEIKSVDGYPHCNTATWKRICQWMQDLTERLNKDRRYDKQVMPGGAWLNWGFSCHGDACKELKDWQVLPAPVVLAEVTATECVGAT